MDGRRIFINTGALMEATTPNQIIGVLAHETGHIAGGHLARLREQLAAAQTRRSSPCCSASARWSPAHAPGRQRPGRGRRRRDHGAAGIDPPLAALLSAQPGRTGRPRRREVPHRDRAIVQGHVRDLQAPRRSDRCSRRAAPTPICSRTRCRRSASRPCRRSRAPALLGQEGSAGAAAAPRHDARQDLRLHGAAGHGAAALSAERHEPAGALCPRHLDLPPCRPAQRDRADRRADPDAAEQSLFPRAQGPGAARRRPRRRGGRAAATRRAARAHTRR